MVVPVWINRNKNNLNLNLNRRLVGPTASLDIVAKIKYLSLLKLNPNCPAYTHHFLKTHIKVIHRILNMPAWHS
jgi:hypothetical protein